MTLREIGPGTIAVLFGNGLGVASIFGIRWLMARTLTPAEVGLVMLALAVCFAVGGVSLLGLQTAASHHLTVARAHGRDDAARAGARTALVLAATVSIAATVVVVAAAPGLERLFAEPGLARLLWLAAPSIVALAIGGALYGVARAFDDLFGRVLVRDGIGHLCRLLAVAAACTFLPRGTTVVIAFTLGVLIGEGSFVLFALRRGWISAPSPSWDRGLVRSLPPFALLGLLFQAAQWFDLILLGVFAPAAVVGVYSIARGVARILDLAGDTASQQFLASASAAHARGGADGLRPVFAHTRTLMACLLLPAVAVLAAEPGFLLGWVFGPDYAAGAPALRVLALAIGSVALLGYSEKALVAAGHAKAATVSASIAVAAGIGVLVWRAPQDGALGAALGWATFAVIQAGSNALFLWRTSGVHAVSRDLFAVARFAVLPTALALGAARLASAPPWPTIFAVGAIGAAGGLWAMRRVDRAG